VVRRPRTRSGILPRASAPWQIAPTTLSFPEMLEDFADVFARIEIEGRAAAACHVDGVVLSRSTSFSFMVVLSFATS
jgi:hypothetical protein